MFALKSHLDDKRERELPVGAGAAVLVQLPEVSEQLRGEAGAGKAGGQAPGRGRGTLSARGGRGLARARAGGLEILTFYPSMIIMNVDTNLSFRLHL